MSKRKSFNFLILLIIAAMGVYLYLDNRRVNIIDAHHGIYSAAIVMVIPDSPLAVLPIFDLQMVELPN